MKIYTCTDCGATAQHGNHQCQPTPDSPHKVSEGVEREAAQYAEKETGRSYPMFLSLEDGDPEEEKYASNMYDGLRRGYLAGYASRQSTEGPHLAKRLEYYRTQKSIGGETIAALQAKLSRAEAERDRIATQSAIDEAQLFSAADEWHKRCDAANAALAESREREGKMRLALEKIASKRTDPADIDHAWAQRDHLQNIAGVALSQTKQAEEK